MKILVILGPTASGKSDLAVKIAEQIAAEKLAGYSSAEIISADSRQVYRGLDIGTGKITKEEMRGILHHCLDIADPSERFSVSNWKVAAEKAVADISSRGKLPIICGGTGFYISALIDGLEFPDVEIDPEEQKELEAKAVEELFSELEKIDTRRAADMKANGDYKNKRRVVRALLIARELGSVPPISGVQVAGGTAKVVGAPTKYEPIIIGVSIPDAELKERIRARLIRRLDNGMIEEAEKLHSSGPSGQNLSYERMDELGLEYRYLAKYLKGEFGTDGEFGANKDSARKKLIEILSTKIWQYARRQKTWFKRDKRIKWFDLSKEDGLELWLPFLGK